MDRTGPGPDSTGPGPDQTDLRPNISPITRDGLAGLGSKLTFEGPSSRSTEDFLGLVVYYFEVLLGTAL